MESASVRFVIGWTDMTDGQEYPIILPDVYFVNKLPNSWQYQVSETSTNWSNFYNNKSIKFSLKNKKNYLIIFYSNKPLLLKKG